MSDDLRDLERLVEAAEARERQVNPSGWTPSWMTPLLPAARACLERLKAEAEDGGYYGDGSEYQPIAKAEAAPPAPPPVDLEADRWARWVGEIKGALWRSRTPFNESEAARAEGVLDTLLAAARSGRAAREALGELVESGLRLDHALRPGGASGRPTVPDTHREFCSALAKAQAALRGGA